MSQRSPAADARENDLDLDHTLPYSEHVNLKEFFYWLQGYFELGSKGDSAAPILVYINNARAECIHRQATLVRMANPNVAADYGKPFARVEFLAELLQDPKLHGEARDELSRKMQIEIVAQFKHMSEMLNPGDDA
jgi:hypothetical protein